MYFHRFLLFALLLILIPIQAEAFRIYLKDGRIIDTPTYEKKGDTLVYQKYGGDISIPITLVDRIVVQQNTGRDDDPMSMASRPSQGRGSKNATRRANSTTRTRYGFKKPNTRPEVTNSSMRSNPGKPL